MNAFRCAIAGLVVLGVTACGEDSEVTLAPRPPIAFVRYVHIVPDTSAMDWRPIDAVENSPWAYAMTFRANTPYQAMGAGTRRLRIFPTSEDISITSQIVVDSAISFTANTYYTVVHIGLARPGQAPADRLWVIEDQIPATIGANQIALRVIHAGVGLGAVDIGSSSSTTGTFTNVFTARSYGTASAYQLVPTGAIALRATDAGASTVVAAASLMPAGTAAGGGLSAAGGSTIGGSAVTAIVVPRSVAGSRAPATFTAPGVIYLIDRAPK